MDCVALIDGVWVGEGAAEAEPDCEGLALGERDTDTDGVSVCDEVPDTDAD